LSVFDEIRRASAAVACQAKWVALNQERLEILSGDFVAGAQAGPDADPAHHQREDEASTLAFVLTLDAVNFGSGWFPHLEKRPGASGYFTIAAGLKDHFDAHGALAPAALAEMESEQCARIFGQHPGRGPISGLMDLFAQSWRDLGGLVAREFGGSFAALVESAGQSAANLVGLLSSMPLYRDVEDYGGLRVPFYKRAQITCSDLAETFGGAGPGRFDDLDDLTIFADNLVPHVLRREGVLEYDPDLLARIGSGELIALGSEEEIEIRAVALHAVERLCESLAERGYKVSPRRLDAWLWQRGQAASMKSEPRHRTRCPYY
jgi:hypothetical protein